MKRAYLTVVSAVLMAALVAALAQAQAAYQPKFKGDPGRSESEAAALGYMRTFLRAQKIYKKKYGQFTHRMAATNRGDYTVVFKSHKEKDAFEITMVPKQLDADHRSFFSDEQGTIRGDEQKEADEGSEVLKAD